MTPIQLGAHVPWAQADTYLDRILGLGLIPELAIKGPELDELDSSRLRHISQLMSRAEVRPKVHAPFFDLNPGALDPLIREVTAKRLMQTLVFAGHLQADLMVIHPGVDKWRYPNLGQTWLNLALDFYPPLIEQAAKLDCRLAIENIYEESPDLLVKLVNGLDSPWFGHCFDAGHWHLFGRRPMAEWLSAISQRLFHLHLHDNHGRADEHLPVGAGTIDFLPLHLYLNGRTSLPSATLEAHNEEHLIRSLQAAKTLFAASCRQETGSTS